MAPVQCKRNAQGQYEIAFNTTEEGSIVGKVVREEYEGFIERLKARLNTLSATDLADIEMSTFFGPEFQSIETADKGIVMNL